MIGQKSCLTIMLRIVPIEKEQSYIWLHPPKSTPKEELNISNEGQQLMLF